LACGIFFIKNEKILGRKHIYLPHAQTAIYDSKIKLFLKQGISHQLGRDAVVRFECENWSKPQVRWLIGLWNIFHKKLMITSIAEFSHSNRTTASRPS
jgi:hypothetical protein